MPQWIHDRAKHIKGKNPGMPESESWAIATQQAHAAGKSPSGYGTSKGRADAHKKYDSPKSAYKKTANPKSKSKSAGIDLGSLLGFSDELQKIATGTAGVPGAAMPASSMKLPKAVSVPRDVPEMKNVQDSLGSTKASQPPPVTKAPPGGF